MKSTAYKSYYELIESGDLSKMEIAVANLFVKHGAMTGRQASGLIPGAWKRLAALQDAGVVSVQGTTKDRNTGKIVSVWAFTGNQPLLHDLPRKVIQKKSGYKPDGIELGRLWDKGFECGVRAALAVAIEKSGNMDKISLEDVEEAVTEICKVRE